jgi:hypothetical protein
MIMVTKTKAYPDVAIPPAEYLAEEIQSESADISTTGSRPIKRMLQGSVLDPFGQLWLIGQILE